MQPFRQAESGLFKGMNPRVTAVSIAIMVIAVGLAAYGGEQTGAALVALRTFLTPLLEWYYVLLVAMLLILVIWLGVGRYKNVRLGSDEEAPEFTFFSWVTMLFAAGTGVGILFWSVAQPILQFQENPFVERGMTPEAATVAMRLTYFHWGLNCWAIFSFVALVLAYFAFRRDRPLTLRSSLEPLLGDRVKGWPGDVVDVLAVFATVFGIATTLGLGVQQMNAGLTHVFGLDPSWQLQLAVIIVIMAIATASVVSGVRRGVRLLSESNFWLSVAVVVFMLLFGPTQYLIGLIIEAAGDYLQNLLALSFHTNVTRGDPWQAEWTVFFWGWVMAWSPFVGLFIARISRGRTLREFVTGALLVPTVITMVWIGLFGGTALHHELFGAGGIVDAVERDVPSALFVMIDAMDLGVLGRTLALAIIVLIGTYLITSANAGTLVVNTILAGGDPDPPTGHRILWGVVLGVLTAVLLLAGGLDTLQAAVIAAALPFSAVIIMMIVGLIKALQDEPFAARSGHRKETPHEPWIETDAGLSCGLDLDADPEPQAEEAAAASSASPDRPSG